MSALKINFRGLVDLHVLPTTEPLLPLYEAIVNSIQSIEEAGIENGRIEIEIQREAQMQMFGESWETDIDNIIIKDNGIGFNNQNFESFDTYATDFKVEKGCKGVGRIMWLKAFCGVEIDSVYCENEKIYNRKFSFDINNSVNNMSIEEMPKSIEPFTTVKLIGMMSKIKKVTPKRLKTIARDIFNHCFVYFITTDMPEICLKDENEVLNINSLFEEYKKEKIVINDFKVNGHDFKIIHSKNFNSSSATHIVNFCAHSRKVSAININTFLNNVNSRFVTDEGEFSYNGYVISEFLDNNVNRERTAFNIPEIETNLFENITKEDILNIIKPLVMEFLKKDIDNYSIHKYEKIKEFICSKYPRYRVLLKNFPEFINNIVLTADEEKLELELFKQEQVYKFNLKQEGKNIEKQIKSNKNVKELIKQKTSYAEKISDLGKSSLAEYILHRKAVLDILDENLKYSNYDGLEYAYEENIHQIIFPMQTTSDDIDYQSHNLWIIDEKLAYHYYLASDKKLSSMPPLSTTSDNEPDIIIFDKPFAFTDEDRQPFKNISIIEFKRPGRNSYSNSENPIQQIIEYMDDIIAGKIKTKDGRYIESCDNLRFYCYIICDMTENIKKYSKQRGFKSSPDGIGSYYFLDNYKAYMEIIPYSKLIQDSKQRNKILFDKLFMQ